MIYSLEGTIEHKTTDAVVLNVNNVGYEINISLSTYDKLPPVGKQIKFYIVETVGIYGGGTTLYGFLSQEEKEIFLAFKEGLKNTGAKKALEYLDKATKSLPDFQRAVSEKNTKLLTSIFGFRKQTAEKIVALLQDKLRDVKVSGKEKWVKVYEQENTSIEEAVRALVSLGYRETQAKNAVEQVLSELEKIPETSELIKLALKYVT